MPFYHNHLTITGNLTRDPELRSTTRSQVANFSIAVNRRYRVEEEWHEEVSFFDCEAWGGTAERVGQSLQKGSPVFIDGRLKQDSWTDQNGRKQSRVRIVADRIGFLHRPNEPVGGRQEDRQAVGQTAGGDGGESYDEPPF